MTDTWKIKPIFEEIKPFRDGKAIVKKDGLWGMIDRTGATVVSFRYEKISDSNEGIFAVSEDGHSYTFLSPDGKKVPTGSYELATGFWDGLALVATDYRENRTGWGDYLLFYINRAGKIVHTMNGRASHHFIGQLHAAEGMLPEACGNNRFGFVRLRDGVRSACAFVRVEPFKHGIARVATQPNRVEYDTKYVWTYIDTNFRILTDWDYERLEDFSDGAGLAFIKAGYNHYYRFIDAEGRVLFDRNFRTASSFSEGLAFVSEESNVTGYIDTRGKMQISLPRNTVYGSPFQSGTAFIGLMNTEDFKVHYHKIDKNGRFLRAEPSIEFLTDYESSYRAVVPSEGLYWRRVDLGKTTGAVSK